MTSISAHDRGVYRAEMDAAREAENLQVRWRHLERAHIVSQPDPWLHTCNPPRCWCWRCASKTAGKRWGRYCGWPLPPPAR